MPALPAEIAAILAPFAPLFGQAIWIRFQFLFCGAVLSHGPRTVCSILRTLGLGDLRSFQSYHRLFNRARWSSLQVAQVLLSLLVEAFAPSGPLVLGIDELLERRWGKKIAARGIYHDSTRSSRSFFVKSSGLRWISLHLLVPIPWAKRIWALPFLTALAPSQRYHKKRGQRHKKITDWARQLVARVRRWWPRRQLILVGDPTYSAIELLHWCQSSIQSLTLITRLRLDAALYRPAPKAKPCRVGRPRLKGTRLPTLAQRLKNPKTRWQKRRIDWYGQGQRLIEFCTGVAVWYHSGKPPVTIRWVLVRDPKGVFQTQAFLSTKTALIPLQILRYYMRRWPMEVTFQEVRTHLGLDGQRQWNERAIARTTPFILSLFSLVTLIAHTLQANSCPKLQTLKTAWYQKHHPTFSDALAWVRGCLWREESFWTSIHESHDTKILKPVFKHMTDIICRVA